MTTSDKRNETNSYAPNALITEYRNIVEKAISKLPSKVLYGSAFDIDDLRQEGFIALLVAYKTFNKNKGNFPGYAKQCVNNAIADALRQQDIFSQRLRADERLLKAAEENPKTLEDLSAMTGLSIKKIKEIRAWRNYQVAVPVETLEYETNVTLNPEEAYQLSSTSFALRKAIAELPEQANRILLDRIVYNKTIREIAEKEGLSPARVSQISSKTMKLLEKISEEN